MIEIPLTRGFVALVDDEDAFIAHYQWRASNAKTGGVYGVRFERVNRKPCLFYIHRQVMGIEPGNPFIVDHMDGNSLNNQKSNLRITTVSENTRNRLKAPNRKSSSQYMGVSKKPSGAWVARIKHDGKNKHLGTFRTEDEAHRARLIFEKDHWGIQPIRAELHKALQAGEKE